VKHQYGKFAEARLADKLFRMNYNIHVGAIAGIAGKVTAFLASLIAASMPVTGFVIWWGRRRKTRTAVGKKRVAAPAFDKKPVM
jgi:uncharacterized iron-regulated membrane protein